MTQSLSQQEWHSILAYELHGNCYLNFTAHCTLRCSFCPKYNRTWEVQGYDLRLHHEPDAAEVLEAIGDATRFNEIVFCGLGEPTTRLTVLLDIAHTLKKQGIYMRVNTDGLANLREGYDTTPQLAQAVNSLSISLNAQSEVLYNRHTRPKLPHAYTAMLDFSSRAKEAGLEVTLTAIDGLDGVDISACQRIAKGLGVNFRRRVLDEVG